MVDEAGTLLGANQVGEFLGRGKKDSREFAGGKINESLVGREGRERKEVPERR